MKTRKTKRPGVVHGKALRSLGRVPSSATSKHYAFSFRTPYNILDSSETQKWISVVHIGDKSYQVPSTVGVFRSVRILSDPRCLEIPLSSLDDCLICGGLGDVPLLLYLRDGLVCVQRLQSVRTRTPLNRLWDGLGRGVTYIQRSLRSNRASNSSVLILLVASLVHINTLLLSFQQ